MFKFICVFLITFLAIVFGIRYDCGLKKTINLNLNELIFFETLNYPFARQYHECQLNFTMTELNNAHKFVFAYKQSTGSDGRKFLIADRNFSLHNYIYDGSDVRQLQGFIAHIDINDGCPLEGLSKPMLIHDDTEVIYIQSTYYGYEKRIRPCKWEFKTTQNYGFKIVIEKLNISSSTQLTIKNSTKVFLVDRMVDIYNPYYNRDNYMQIFLSFDNSTTSNLIQEVEFQAYVTVVRNVYHKMNATNCTLGAGVQGSGMFNWILFYGYDNNAQCTFEYVILPNHGFLFYAKNYNMEKGVDYLHYYIDGENNTVISNVDKYYIIEVKKDEPSKYFWIQFISDGSVQGGGFEVDFYDYACECGSEIISCGEPIWSLTGPTGYYCSNMKCNYTFESCPQYMYTITIDAESNVDDVFRISSNNEIVLEINKYNSGSGKPLIYLNPKNVNTLEAITSFSSDSRFFVMHQNPQGHEYFNETINDRIILTSNKSFSLIDNSVNRIIEVMHDDLEKSNLSFIIYCNQYLGHGQIFKNTSMTINYSNKNCFGNSNPYKCILPQKSFVIVFDMEDNPYTLYAVRLSKPSIGCILEENIFVVKETDENFSIVGISNSEGPCVLKLLISDDNTYYYISHLWTTSTNENVKVYIGIDTSHLLFQFNSKDLKKWDFIGLFSSFYSIHIPSNSTFFMTLKRYNSETLNIDHQFSSIITTPNFNIFHEYFGYPHGEFISFYVGDIPLKITILHYKMFSGNYFYFKVNKEILHINYTAGTSTIFKNQLLDIGFDIFQAGDGFDAIDEGAVLYIETL